MSKEFIIQEHQAQRMACKASIMVQGLPGSGKSGVLLAIAFVLAGGKWEDITATDTENKSLPLFVGLRNIDGEKIGHFNVVDLDKETGFKPSYYVAIKDYAVQKGRTVYIEDSISHAWQYSGGLLEMVNAAKKKQTNSKDQYAAWGDEQVVAEKNTLLEMIRDHRIHVLTSVRVKEKMEYVDDPENPGKKKLQSLGEQQLQQGDLKYEPDLVLDMVQAGYTMDYPKIVFPKVYVLKSRYAIFKKDEEYTITPELIMDLKKYLEEGEDPEVLLEKQRLEYIEGVKEFLDHHPNQRAIWKVLKDEAGLSTKKLEEIPLKELKQLYLKVTL